MNGRRFLRNLGKLWENEIRKNALLSKGPVTGHFRIVSPLCRIDRGLRWFQKREMSDQFLKLHSP